MKISQIPTTTYTMSWSLKHWLKVSFFPLVLLLTCCNEPTQIGKQLQQIDVLGTVNFTDTLQIRTHNILLDSLCVDPLEYFYNNTGASTPTRFNLLAGNYDNPSFGKVSVSTYVQFGLYSTPTLDNTYSCDSVALRMYYNSNYANGYFPYNITNTTAQKYISAYTYGDTTKLHALNFYEPDNNLAVTVSAPTTKSQISYSNTGFLGTTGSFYPDPAINSLGGSNFFRVKLSSSLGDRLLSSMLNQSDFTSNFKSYFNGIAIVPDPMNTAVLGFASRDNTGTYGPFLDFFYSNGTSTAVFILRAPTSGFVFNSVSQLSRSSQLNSLQNPYDSISTDLTGNLCYVQGASGLGVKVTLPNFLTYLNSSNEKITVTNAFLDIKRSGITNLDDGGFDHKLPPPYITLYALDDNNKPYKYSSTNIYQTVTTDRLGVNPVRALYNYSTQSYSLDITNYLQNLALLNKTPKFIIAAGFNNQLVNGVVFGDAKSGDSPMKLRLYYAKVKL